MGPILTKDEYLKQLEPTRDAEMAPGEECPVCYDPIEAPTYTACRHLFCFECLKQWGTTSNTCPTCRQELYRVPDVDEQDEDDDDDEQDEEDGEDEEDEESDPAWLDLDFGFNRSEASRIMVANVGKDINDAILSCSLHWKSSFVSYDDLLPAAMAFIHVRYFDPTQAALNMPGLACSEGWKIVASAIETALWQRDGHTMSGQRFFKAMESEIQRQIRASDDLSFVVWRKSEDEFKRRQYIWFEVCITAVLRQVVEKSYTIAREQQEGLVAELPDKMSDFTGVPFVVHPHDLYAAHQEIEHLLRTAENLDHDWSPSQAYVSKSLLMPYILATVQLYVPAMREEFCQTFGEGTAKLYDHSWHIAMEVCVIAMFGISGDTMLCGDLYDRLLAACSSALEKPTEYPEELRNEATFPEQHSQLLEHMEKELRLVLMPAAIVAVKLYDQTQLLPANAAPNDNGLPTTESASE